MIAELGVLNAGAGLVLSGGLLVWRCVDPFDGLDDFLLGFLAARPNDYKRVVNAAYLSNVSDVSEGVHE